MLSLRLRDSWRLAGLGTLGAAARAAAGRRVANRPLAELPSPPQTLRRIERQEALRRRGRPQFTVVVVAVGPCSANSGLALRLLQGFLRRARAGDEIGWLGQDRMALILPLTKRDGAQKFADQLCRHLGVDAGVPAFELFTI